MSQQQLSGAALLAEVAQSLAENPKMGADKIAIRCGYVKPTRSRSGEARIRPQLEAYYEALLLAQGAAFGLTVPETSRKTSSRPPVISYKILTSGAGVVPHKFMELLDCAPGDFFFIKQGSEEGTILLRKDVERSEQARLEAANSMSSNEDESEEEEDDDEEHADAIEEDGDEDEEIVVQQPAIPGVSSTTVRIPQTAS